MSTTDIHLLSERLIEIAATDGGVLPHAIETNEAREEAIRLISFWLYPRTWSGDTDSLDVKVAMRANQLLLAIRDAPIEYPIQVNPIFKKQGTDLFSLSALSTDAESEETFELLTPLPQGIHASFYVYYISANDALHLQKVYVSRREWSEMTRAFTGVDSSGSPGPLSADEEILATQAAIASYEKIVGMYAGTSKDRGSIEGNKYVRTAPPDERQQHCTQDALTASQLLYLLQAHGLLVHQRHDRADAVAMNGGLHMAAQAKLRDDSSEIDIIWDTWLGNNGELPRYFTSMASWYASYNSPD